MSVFVILPTITSLLQHPQAPAHLPFHSAFTVFMKILKPPSPIHVAHVCMGVGPSTELKQYQWLEPERKVLSCTSSSQLPMAPQLGVEALGSSPPSYWSFNWLDLVQLTTCCVLLIVHQPPQGQKTAFTARVPILFPFHLSLPSSSVLCVSNGRDALYVGENSQSKSRMLSTQSCYASLH